VTKSRLHADRWLTASMDNIDCDRMGKAMYLHKTSYCI